MTTATINGDDLGASAALHMALRDIAPLALAVVPFAMAIGSALATSGLSGSGGLAGSAFLLAGTAQLASIDLASAAAGMAAIVGTVVLINARFVLYSAGLERWFSELPRRRRLLLAIPLVDQTFMLCERRFGNGESARWRERYYLGASATLVFSYLAGQMLGYTVGAALPTGLGLHLAAPLAFAGMLATAADDRSRVVAATVGALVVVGAAPLPGGLALLVAALAGVVAGSVFGERP